MGSYALSCIQEVIHGMRSQEVLVLAWAVAETLLLLRDSFQLLREQQALMDGYMHGHTVDHLVQEVGEGAGRGLRLAHIWPC